jgi:radical S-adenosyl methionine domain-containing protein 2
MEATELIHESVDQHQSGITIPPTINLHTIRACNYKCGFCFAGFQDCATGQLPQRDLHEILRQIAYLPLYKGRPRKVNFVGGEPTLSKTVVEDIRYAKSLGLTTSIVTNGSRLTPAMLQELSGHLDLLAISIDSVDTESNRRIGRHFRGVALTEQEYLERLHLASDLGMAIKVNTVVNQLNVHEDMTSFIRQACPIRWKLFKVLRIEGENGSYFDGWAISESQFQAYIERHGSLEKSGIPVVPENNEAMYGSYAFISPDGRFIDNSQGEHRYGRPIVQAGLERAFAEIQFSLKKFEDRGGVYDL